MAEMVVGDAHRARLLRSQRGRAAIVTNIDLVSEVGG